MGLPSRGSGARHGANSRRTPTEAHPWTADPCTSPDDRGPFAANEYDVKVPTDAPTTGPSVHRSPRRNGNASHTARKTGPRCSLVETAPASERRVVSHS